MTRYFLGVDIGNTKSHALIADEHGRALGLGKGGDGNPEGIGYSGLARVLQEITQQALQMAGLEISAIAGAGFGVAGYDWPFQRQPTLEAIATLGLQAPVEAVNDAVIGLLAGASQGWGVNISAGTSNNCRGRDLHGREGRISGNGMYFGEFGGAYELVWKALHAVAYEWTQRGPATQLTPAFLAHCGASSLPDLLEGLILGRYHLGAEAAPLVFQVAQAGDPAARAAIEWAGHELGELAVCVLRQIGALEAESKFPAESEFPKEVEVVLSGSLYQGGEMLIAPLRQTVLAAAPLARFVHLTAPPVVGATLLGMEVAQLPRPWPREQLIAATQALLETQNPA